MTELRTIRHSRNLTLLDLAQLTGIPARALAEAEYGLRLLSNPEIAQLALVLGLNEPPQLRLPALAHAPTATLTLPRPLAHTLVAAALLGALAVAAVRPLQRGATGSLWSSAPGTSGGAPAAMVGAQFTTAAGDLLSALLGQPIPPASPTPSAQPDANLAAPIVAPTATASATTTPSATLAPTSPPPTHTPARTAETPLPAGPILELMPTLSAAPPSEALAMIGIDATDTPPQQTGAPSSAFAMSAQGPQGCPLLPQVGRVFITQGYGVGTHAPAETMGGIDLAISGGVTLHTVVVATHAGVVQLAANTWPAGNHIWLVHQASGWSSGYAHLAEFLVADGQYVEAGTPIGLVGSTGWSTGPHLHYHVWYGSTNMDPTGLVGECF